MKQGKGKILIAVGGNWGSESKGNAVAHLTRERHVDIAVRTGSSNAGHTQPLAGEFYVNQVLPVSWSSRNCKLVIGRGAYVEPTLLERELDQVQRVTGESVEHLRARVFVDSGCGVELPEHMDAEKSAGLHGRMGSTAHGCMEAQIARMRRGFDYKSFREWYEKTTVERPRWAWADTVKLLNRAYDDGSVILLEGTQGTGLDFLHGSYPYVTSRPTVASHWMTEAGLSPNLNTEILMVCRTFPIRVAGNSGPMGKEIPWAELARRTGKVSEDAISSFESAELLACEELGLPCPPHLLNNAEREKFGPQISEVHRKALTSLRELSPSVYVEIAGFFEITTVTKKLRRIAEPDFGYIRRAVALNRPDSIVLNFLNYVFPEVEPCKTWEDVQKLPSFPTVDAYVADYAQEAGVPISHVGVSRETTFKIV